MKLKIALLLIISLIPNILHSQEVYYFTDGKKHYAKLLFSDAADGNLIATLLTPNYSTYRYTGSGQGIMEFSTWTVGFSLNGSVFHYKEPRIYIDADINWVETPTYRYNQRISKSDYEANQIKLPATNPSIGVTGINSGSKSNQNNNTTTNSYTQQKCKYCGGGGGCSSCHGKGYKFNNYSGHNDTCPSCNGSGRCFNCYGSGVQR